jgi:hypothetical protein
MPGQRSEAKLLPTGGWSLESGGLSVGVEREEEIARRVVVEEALQKKERPSANGDGRKIGHPPSQALSTREEHEVCDRYRDRGGEELRRGGQPDREAAEEKWRAVSEEG